MERNYYNLYIKYKKKYISLKNKENIQIGGGSKKDVFLFKAEWCPHCKGFLPAWEKLKEDHGDNYNFVTYDGDKNEEEVKQWQIQGFPTIIVKKDNEAMEYVGPNEYNSVLSFIKNI